MPVVLALAIELIQCLAKLNCQPGRNSHAPKRVELCLGALYSIQPLELGFGFGGAEVGVVDAQGGVVGRQPVRRRQVAEISRPRMLASPLLVK